jgi:hypothetical protein
MFGVGFASGVNKGFALGYHREGVAGQKKRAVYLFKGCFECTRIIKI